MLDWGQQNFGNCPLPDKRLQQRASAIGQALTGRFGMALSMVFGDTKLLKRAYEFFANVKVTFNLLTQPHRDRITEECTTLPVILSVGDTTYLDYKAILTKTEGYGPIANGGQGLILHTSIAVEPEQGLPLGILWQKIWHRTQDTLEQKNSTKLSKKQKQAAKRKANKNRQFEEKESYRWVEGMSEIAAQFERIEKKIDDIKKSEAIGSESIASATRIVHVFDAEADIAEVFDKVRDRTRTGLLVRAAYDRCINEDTRHLWAYMESSKIAFQYEVKVAATEEQPERTATLAVRFSPVSLKSPAT